MTGTISTIGFFLAILAVYYIIPCKWRWMLLLGASVFFYVKSDWKMCFLIAGSIGISYYAGLKIEGSKTEKERKNYLTVTVAFLVAVLFVFKYFNFFIESVSALFSSVGFKSSEFTLRLIVPLGISYYTFKIISYLVDVYKGKMSAEKHFGYYALYVSFFPQILCGPIERAENFLPQLRNGCKFEEPLFTEGMQRMIIGLFKKLVIADRLAGYVGAIFDAPLEYPALASIMAVIFYSIQIYCDFSGYSDMAIGMGMMFGIRTKENFLTPYFSKNIKEFWKRWHISLSSWLRDYIYIPLGGNRKGKVRAKLNVFLTFLISGLWHGSSWNFVLWGGIHGIWNMFSKPQKKEETMWSQFLRMAITFCGVTFAWLFFRAKDLTTAVTILKHIVTDFNVSKTVFLEAILPFTGNNISTAHFMTVCMLIVYLAVFEGRKNKGKGTSIGWFVIMFSAIMLLGQFGNSSFLYGQF